MKHVFLSVLVALSSIVMAYDTVDQGDTTKIKMGKTLILFLNNADTTDYDFDLSECEEPKEDSSWVACTFEIGINGYTDNNYSLSLPDEYQNMDINYSKSRAVGFNFMLKRGNIIGDRVYISPGIGINWNNHVFKNNVNVTTSNDTTQFLLDTNINYNRYKLRATYLQVPLILGARIGSHPKHNVGLQVGVIASYKMFSVVRAEYDQGGSEYEMRIKDDFNINPFKFEALARISFSNVGFYAKYGLNPLFEEGRAAEVYPFSVGLTFGGF